MIECTIIMSLWFLYKLIWTVSSKKDFANQLSDAFIDTKIVVSRSHIVAAIAPDWLIFPQRKFEDWIANESKACVKRDRPIGFKDKFLEREWDKFETLEEFGSCE